MTQRPDPDQVHGQQPALGVLVTNLGTPQAPTVPAVRRYLRQFLADPRVVEVPRALWLPVLHGIILRFRPQRSAAAYAKVWTEQGSPLLCIARRQTDKLQTELSDRLPGPVRVALGMRYGQPAIAGALESLRAAGARRILVFPLYPQYSASTGASTMDAVNRVLAQWRWVPEMRFIMQYHDESSYINALASKVRAFWRVNGRGDRLVMSFHGLPQRYLFNGDPYHCQCHKTARLLAAQLELGDHQWRVTFQSRFGREPWLQPYTDATMKALGKQGLSKVDVVCPGFSADCLETLEEIRLQNAEFFRAAGGGELRYIAALNDDDQHIQALADIAQRHLQGWPEALPQWRPAATTETLERARGVMRTSGMGRNS